ncbi:AIPR family protein [Lentzea albidocapillata]|uniref:AIPR family protein n=1 Tax=Lentzea albidocapillata TaxID=40571 RepID=UPI0013566F55|nr:AIPR family protein [Lentzea albidocapillata]
MTLADESEQFEHFVNFIVLSRHHNQQFTVDDYSCGSGGTQGIDGFALSINNELIANIEELEDALKGTHSIESAITIVQSKRSPSFDLGDFGTFVDAAHWLLTKATPPHGKLKAQHEMLKRLFDESARFVANPICRMYYVTTGTWTNPAPFASKISDTIERLEQSNLFSRIDIHSWGTKEIQSNWRAIDSATEVTIQFDQRTTLPDMQGIQEAYLGVLPGVEFVKLVTDEDGDIRRTLFFDNVRDFQGDNDVNRDILNTLNSDAADKFCVLNNGVTVVARDLKPTGNRFTLKDFQIVNGCQTSYILHRNTASLDGVFVPFRLIIASDEDVANSIARATNNQSPVTPENLMALSLLQRRIENYFDSFDDSDGHRIYYERRSKQWFGSTQVRGTWRVITLRNLMQSFASLYLRIPHTAARYYGDLRGRVGSEVFAERHHPAYYYSAAYAFCKLDHFFRSGAVDRELKPTRYHLLAGLRTLHTKSIKPDSVESNEKKAETACSSFNKLIWNDQEYLKAIARCEKVLRDLAEGREITRDFGRTRDFTDQYLKALLAS